MTPPGSTSVRVGPIARLSFGLVALLIGLVLLADVMLDVVPGQGETQRRVRQRVAENLALQITALLETGDTGTLGKTIQGVLTRDADMRSVTVRRSDGVAVVQRGPSLAPEAAVRTAASTADRLRVPVMAERRVWGEVDIHFAPSEPAGLRAWLLQPGALMLLVIGLGGFALCYAYLRRAMHYLDPSASVPDRVRKALDTLNEGLLIVDQQARIVLANRAFREMHPAASAELNGRRLRSLDWLNAAATGSATPPWEQTLGSGTPVAAQALALPQPEGEATQLLVSSSAILDNRGQNRGCLITFVNVTAVHRANEELRLAMVELEKSRGRIEQQNEDLRRLASRDSLTGCLNRRAFFELAGAAHAQALRERGQLCCLMVDIDHFKSFNDTYGHAVGDQVIQAVARSLSSGLRQVDLLARYGGEEFCVLLPGANEAQAMAVAERMRGEIEAAASSAIRGTEVMPITASFGLTTLAQGARNIELMIDQADQALYTSKKSGRNRVTCWKPAVGVAALV